MNKIHLRVIALFLFLSLVSSCRQQSPQLPSNKGNVGDKEGVSLLAINQNLAKKEDALLQKFAHQRDKAFKKSDIGFWYKVEQLGNGAKVTDSVACKFTAKLVSLQGKVLRVDEKHIVVGKKQVEVGLEEGLKLLNKGGRATIIVPWYLAYGMKGNNPLIPPYTSIIYEITVAN